MKNKSGKGSRAAKASTIQPASSADPGDTIAHNRGLDILDAGAVPRPPPAYRPTEPGARNRRLRKLAGELREKVCLALIEASERDLRADLGKYAPEPEQARPLRVRLSKTGPLRAAAWALYCYAREVDQIARSDALLYLEAEHRQLVHAARHEPLIAARYPALTAFFAARAGAIVEGMTRARRRADVEDEAAPE